MPSARQLRSIHHDGCRGRIDAASSLCPEIRKFGGLAALFFELRIRRTLKIYDSRVVWVKNSLVGRAARVKKTFEPPHETLPLFKVSETMP
jgi:hypothetical protein